MTQFPQINLNGTDAKVLLDEYMNAIAGVANAIECLKQVTCHGRDYQTLPDMRDAASIAFREHGERLEKLQQVHNDLHAIAIEIDRQIGEREKMRGRA